MAFEFRPGQGSLFKNSKKRPDRKDPDMDGRIMLPDGSLHWFKAWKKQDSAGQVFLSCQIGDACQQSAHSRAKANGYQPQPDVDDVIPF